MQINVQGNTNLCGTSFLGMSSNPGSQQGDDPGHGAWRLPDPQRDSGHLLEPPRHEQREELPRTREVQAGALVARMSWSTLCASLRCHSFQLRASDVHRAEVCGAGGVHARHQGGAEVQAGVPPSARWNGHPLCLPAR